jgi:hypothetical protein
MGEPEQDREGQDCQDMIAAPRGLWKVWLARGARTGLEQESGDRQPGQDNWDRTAYIGVDRKAGTRQPGQDSQDRTARTGKPGQEDWDRKVRADSWDSTARIGNRGRMART